MQPSRFRSLLAPRLKPVLANNTACFGLQVKQFSAHKAVVNDICFDEQTEYIASCSDDGSVAVRTAQKFDITLLVVSGRPAILDWLYCAQIRGLYSEEVALFTYGRPVKVGKCHKKPLPSLQQRSNLLVN